MEINNGEDYVRLRYTDTEGVVSEFISDNDEFIYMMSELLQEVDRVDLAELGEPLAGHIRNCIQGNLIQHTANPDEVKLRLNQNNLEKYCKISGNILYFKPHILNYITYHEEHL